MSSDLPSDARSSATDPARELGLAAQLRIRGAPLVEALERHRPGAREHAEATASYAFATAVELGFERHRCEISRETAMLHEIGQVYVPVAVLARPAGERDELEAAAFASHFEAGYRLARGAGIPEDVCGWILRARERHDGGGPERLAGDAVPVESRIIRAACACHTAIAAGEAEGRAPHERAIAALEAGAAGELDPRVAVALGGVVRRAAGVG
jgi:HD-GYP domain-containing protein (c-di-GMP phosphodiesterase class II)